MASFVESRLIGRRLFVSLPVVLAARAAPAQDGEPTYPRSSLVIATAGRDLKFEVELALDDEHRSHGLMFRKKLGPYEGMLFDFFQEMPVAFWMKNTLIPLDIIYIGTDGRIVAIAADARPMDRTPLYSKGPAIGVLEIGGGLAAKLGIRAGDQVRHPFFHAK